MAENTKNSKLFKDFPPVSTREWEEVIQQDLKGADYDKKLVWKPLEGFSVKPYYRSEDIEGIGYIQVLPGDYPFIRGNETEGNTWLVRQDFDAADSPAANQAALNALKQGTESLGFKTCTDCEPSIDGLDKLLNGIDFNKTEVNFISGHSSKKILPILVDYLKAKGQDPKSAKGSFNYGPLNSLTRKGNFCKDEDTTRLKVKELVDEGVQLPQFRLIEVDGSIFHNSGATAVQELAFALAMGAEYMVWLTEQGVPADVAASKIRFTLAVGPNYFMEIAKFRAARLLWAKIVETFLPADINRSQINVHAVTGTWNMTIYDSYVNMLRTSTEAMSAVLGGVHSLTVQPFDAHFQKPSVFSERIARNQQLIIREEAYFSKVVDPAAGSYYIEKLTASIIEHVWNLFLKVDELGGYSKSFIQGFIQNEINAVAQKRIANIANRRDTVLGTNQYPNFGETIDTKVVKPEQVQVPKTEKMDGAIAEPLRPFRVAQAIEELRYVTDSRAKRPKVFMLTLGSLGMRRARAQFSCNFFACAGFEVVDNIGFKTVSEGVKAALEAEAEIVVICSSDEDYATLAPEAFEMLNGKAIFVVAGEPVCKPELEAKGIKHYISVKSNLLETLRYYQQLLK
jgi:methylmalonyl-CoA mutase